MKKSGLNTGGIFYAFPWIQNSVTLDYDGRDSIFEKEKVTIALRAKFKSIVCTTAGCKHNSDGVKKGVNDPK